MNNSFQMVTLFWYHILLHLYQSAASLACLLRLHWVSLIWNFFFFFPVAQMGHCRSGEVQVHCICLLPRSRGWEQYSFDPGCDRRLYFIWKHICICAPWKGTCRHSVMEWVIHYGREEGTKKLMNWDVVTPANSRCSDDAVIKISTCV